MKQLLLANNEFVGSIPSQLGQLQGASVLLKNNEFNDSSPAPLSLCTLRSGVEEFDLVNDTQLCPIQRNALSDFYDSVKGSEWTESTNWLDEYESYCVWFGVICNDGMNNVIELNLRNNGLSGRMSESIGKLTSIEKLDLSDNDIKVMPICSVIITTLSSLTLRSNRALSHQTDFFHPTQFAGINPKRNRSAFQPYLSASQLQCLHRDCA